MSDGRTPLMRALKTGAAIIASGSVVAGAVTAALVLGLANRHLTHAVEAHQVAASSSTGWLTTEAVAVTSTGQAPEAPTLDTTSTALTADGLRLSAYLPGYTLAHRELMSWSAGDATEHFEFDGVAGEVDVFVNVLQQQEDVTPDSADQLISLVTDAAGTQTAIVHDARGAHVVQIANSAGVHVKVAATAKAGETLGDSVLQQIAQSALTHNLAH